MTLRCFLQTLGVPVQDVEEETFDLFAQDLPSQNLGFVDSRASTVDITVAGRDFTIHQSPAVLSSNRAGGTTGAVLWKITPLFAEWLASPTNPLFANGILSSTSLVLELGCGVSALVGLLLAPRVARCVLTDQPYVARLVEQNITENAQAAAAAVLSSPRAGTPASGGERKVRREKGRGGSGGNRTRSTHSPGHHFPDLRTKVCFAPLDWEKDAVTPAFVAAACADDGKGRTRTAAAAMRRLETRSFDLVFACDCVYNEALIEPLVSTCAEACRLRSVAAGPEPGYDSSSSADDSDDPDRRGRGEGEHAEVLAPTVCLVAQQLREPSVFEAWLECFSKQFHVWRVPEEMLKLPGQVGPGLGLRSGFAVHVGVLKGSGIEEWGLEGVVNGGL
ncbi:hypothetical protein VTJ04DRAFT_4442 [Mycothermus thermophilus]|uniref:uncharacterized protein n=1 Tax=Humicola insolens TaxID=85995 RepID=UPI0037441B58